jgi:hypothetical protein
MATVSVTSMAYATDLTTDEIRVLEQRVELIEPDQGARSQTKRKARNHGT